MAAPGTGGIVHRGSRKLIQQRADVARSFPATVAVAMRYDGDDLERRGIAAHDDGDGVVALLGPVDADAVPRPGRIRPGPLGGGTRLAAPECVRDRPRGCVCRAWRRTSAPRRPGAMARPSALGSWSSYSTSHIVRDSSPRFRVTWSSDSHPWGSSVSR